MNYLEVINIIKDDLEANELIERVQNEDLDDLDLDKASRYPLAAFYVDNVNLDSPTNAYNVNLLLMDILDVNNATKEDNKDFIWNECLAIVNNFVSRLRRGDLFGDRVQVEGDVLAEFFTDRFDKGLAGVGVSVTINVPNEMTIC
jgi:hypothetical protein